MLPFSPVRAILRKREGGAHPPHEIEEMITGFLNGSVADYQMTAWMMAILFRGMTREETSALTRAMLGSGERLPPWPEGPPVVDKHSTGGVGDKVSLIVAPLAAACGLRVPMLSGRALGHTGGTLDKLESIPGYRVDLELDAFLGIVQRVGCSIAGASAELVPADQRLYSLRDVAGIVESPPLIVSSILSKKSAARLDGLVLDVKVGRGGFLARRVQARRLGRMLVDAASDLGMRSLAVLTRMDAPLGRAIGNALEVQEAISFLRGDSSDPDLEEVVLEIVVEMMRLGGEGSRVAATARATEAWRTGRALEKLASMIEAHGGDPSVTERPSKLPHAELQSIVAAATPGWIGGIDARGIAEIVIDIGGGRRRVEDSIDPRVGIRLRAKTGDRVEPGTPVAELHLSRVQATDRLNDRVRAAIRIVPRRPKPHSLVVETVAGEEVRALTTPCPD